MSQQHYVYILANPARTLYVGSTNDLQRRVYEHRHEVVESFTRRYHIHRLVHFEVADDHEGARAREAQIKSWRRARKEALIEEQNPEWRDLAAGWFSET